MSLQALDAFEAVARTGSLQGAARIVGLTVSSISHHLGRLEADVGTPLLDRTRRPLVLTPEGEAFLRRVSEGLRLIRQARREAEIGGLSAARAMRIGLTDDLEGEIGPALALEMTRAFPRAALSMRTVTSFEAAKLVADGSIDVAVAAETGNDAATTLTLPLLRDPFIAAFPADGASAGDADRTDLPFLRFSERLLIGRQIQAQVRRSGFDSEARYEFEDAASILRLVGGGHGWAILTPAVCARAYFAAENVILRPLPIPAFSRRLVLHGRGDTPPALLAAVATILRHKIDAAITVPMIARHSWLSDMLRSEGDH